MKNARNAAVCAATTKLSRRLATMLLMTALLMMNAATVTAGTHGARAIIGSCGPKNATSDRLITSFKAFVAKSDMGGTIEKTTLGLATVTPSQVVLVVDDAICTKAAAAFDSKQLEKRSSYTLYVVTLGTSYGVEDTRVLQAGFETADVFDSHWKYIGGRQIHS